MKQDKNKKGKKKDTKQKQNEEPQFSGFTLAMGQMDLIMEINFKDEDLLNPNSSSNDDKYLNIEKFESIKDLSFLQDKKEDFLNTIKIKPNNNFVKQLLLGNIISKKKCFIDFICYGRPKFEGEEEFFEKIFDYVTVNNKLQINKTPLQEGSRWSLIIDMKHKDINKKITVGKTSEEENEEKEKEEAEKKEEENKKKKEKEENEKQEMENRKQQKIQEYKEKREKEKQKKENGEEENAEDEQGADEPNEENNEENNDDEEEKEEEEEDYEENEAMKEKKIPKFRRKNSVLCNLTPSCTKYDLIYINHEDIEKIPGDFKMGDLLELLLFFKKKKSNIFINFYKNEKVEKEPKDEEEKKKLEEEKKKEDEKKKEEKEEKKKEEKKKEEERKNREKELNDINTRRKELTERQKDLNENKKKEIKGMEEQAKKDELENIKVELDNLNEKELDIKDEKRAEEEVKKEFKKKKEKEKEAEEKKKNKKQEKEMKLLNEIFYLTNAYFFDSKQACEVFNNHYQCFTTDNPKNKKDINKQKVYDYFITAIARGLRDEVEGNKIGLFMDDFNKYCIIYATKKSGNKQEFNPQPHPKINPHNIALVEEYRSIIKKNKNDYYSIFAALSAHEICSMHGVSTEIVYPSFLYSLIIIKRKVECEKNGIAINEDQLYKVKLNEKSLQQDLEKLASGDKEGGFVLDCLNKSKSSLKDYVSLYDYHLKGFFSSEIIRKNLKDKGFIDSNGFIMYDPVYRSVMGAQCKNKKKYEGDELKSKIISSIKGIDVPARLKDKELDSKKAIEKQKVPTDKKIPFEERKRKKKKKKNKTGEGNSSSDGNSSEEDRSGSGGEDSSAANNP